MRCNDEWFNRAGGAFLNNAIYFSHTALIDGGPDNLQATADAFDHWPLYLSLVFPLSPPVPCQGLLGSAGPGNVKARPEASQVRALDPGPVELRLLLTEYQVVRETVPVISLIEILWTNGFSL